MFCANCGNETTDGKDFCTDCQEEQLPGLVQDPALPVMPNAGAIATQPGWYLDPTDPTWQRYWDGIAWTSHTFPASSTNQPWAQIAPVAVQGMSFTEAVKAVLTNYVGFSGRARRSEYWWFSLFYEVVAVVVVFSAIAIAVTSAWEPRTTAYPTALDMGGAMLIAVVIADLILLSMFLPSLAVCIRRLHDTNRSGWYYLITLIPLGSIVLLVFLCEDSTMGPNRYGLSPKYV